MRKAIIPFLLMLLVSTGSALAYDPEGGGEYLLGDNVECLTKAQRAEIQADIDRNIAMLEQAGRLAPINPNAVMSLGWPLRQAAHVNDCGYHGISNYVDHNAAVQGFLRDYTCGTRTYDLASGYNHAGTDYFTWPFSQLKQINNDVEIVAAEAGTIVGKFDGNNDTNCGFGAGNWNAVYIRHADGTVMWYGHMKKNSLTTKIVGATVVKGEYLGVVGSSGNSTGPHLHMELRNASGSGFIDPYYNGTNCNPTTSSSLWASQNPYDDSAVNKVSTHSAPPLFPDCPAPETPNFKNDFVPNETVYLLTYLRDQTLGSMGTRKLYRPDNSLAMNANNTFNGTPFLASYWWWTYNLGPTPMLGTWRWEYTYGGRTCSHSFRVTSTVAVEATTWSAVKTLFQNE